MKGQHFLQLFILILINIAYSFHPYPRYSRLSTPNFLEHPKADRQRNNANIDPSDTGSLLPVTPEGFRAGFVTIVGSPNVGKSTLMNRLVGEKISIVTPKAQTTRHRILGVVTKKDVQIIYQDTPGAMEPTYRLQEGMMNFVKSAVKDSDVLLFLTDIFEEDFPVQYLVDRVQRSKCPLVIAINKIDLLPADGKPGGLGVETLEKVGNLEVIVARWKNFFPNADVLPVSAAEGINVDDLVNIIKSKLPVSPALYPEDTLTDRSERFLAAEIIREKVFSSYSQEIPYSSEVTILTFKDDGKRIRIEANIIIERDSQKGIIIGKAGQKIKEVGTEARLDLEEFFEKKVHLELRVKVDKDWRKRDLSLKNYGYL